MMLPGSCAGKVYAIGEVDGIGPCIVMDCIDGGPLYLDNLRLPGRPPHDIRMWQNLRCTVKGGAISQLRRTVGGGIYAKGGF